MNIGMRYYCRIIYCRIIYCRIILSLLLLPSVFSQAAELKGRVVDDEGRPMLYATVFIDEMAQATTTDNQGEFVFGQLPQGEVRLTVSHIGYKTAVIHLNISLASESVLIQMEEEVVQLGELIVLPNGLSMEEYILQQVSSSASALKEKISRFDAQVSFRLEKDIDLSHMPKRRTIRLAAWLMGYARIVDALVENKYLKLVMTEQLSFNQGKMTGSDPKLTEVVPQLPRKQAKAFLKLDKLLKANVYDDLYGRIGRQSKEQGKAAKEGEVTKLHYVGSYEHEGRTVFIVRYGEAEIHVVDGCWQILRIQYMQGDNKMYYEFRELAEGTYLPVSGFAEFHFDSEKYPQGVVVISSVYRYEKVSPRT